MIAFLFHLLQGHALPPLFVEILFDQPALHPPLNLRPFRIQHGKPGGIAVAAFIHHRLPENAFETEAQSLGSTA